MSDGYEVDFDAVDDFAAMLTKVVGDVESLDVATPFDLVGTALPGSQTAFAVTRVAVKMGAGIQVFGEHVDALVTSAHETVASYRAVDARNATRMGVK